MSWLIRSPYPDGITEHPYVVGVSSLFLNNQSSGTLSLPTGWQTGDLLVIQVRHWGSNTVASTISTTGWNYGAAGIGTSASNVGFTNTRFKLATAGETSPTITLPSGALYAVAFMVAYRTSSSLTVRNGAWNTDGVSPYQTSSIVAKSPAALSIFAGGYGSNNTYDPGILTINSDNHLIKHVSSAGSGRGALTHIDVGSNGTYGPYSLAWSKTMSRSSAIVQEIATYDPSSTIPTLVGTSSDYAPLNAPDTNKIIVGAPTGTQEGDLLVFVAYMSGANETTHNNYTFTGSGWTFQQYLQGSFANHWAAIFTKVATASNNNVSMFWLQTTGNPAPYLQMGMMAAYRNATELTKITPHSTITATWPIPQQYVNTRGLLSIFGWVTNSSPTSPITAGTVTPTPDAFVQPYTIYPRSVWLANYNAQTPAQYPRQVNGTASQWTVAYNSASSQCGFLLEIR
jgi:hypothetical protein